MIQLLGTNYGGWLVDLDLVDNNSTIVSAGIGEDISFDLELIKRKSCKILGIDPTIKSHRFIESQNLNNFNLIKKALTSKNEDLVAMYKNSNPQYVSESILEDHKSISSLNYYFTETINLENIFESYSNISLIKMDIEGAEYEVINNLKNIPDTVRQLCVEFHHFCSDKTLEDTKQCIKILSSFGFKKYFEKSQKELAEITFIRE